MTYSVKAHLLICILMDILPMLPVWYGCVTKDWQIFRIGTARYAEGLGHIKNWALKYTVTVQFMFR